MSDLDNFRQETKEWLDKNCPPTMRSGAPSNAPVDEVWGGKKAKYKNPESKIWPVSYTHLTLPTNSRV